MTLRTRRGAQGGACVLLVEERREAHLFCLLPGEAELVHQDVMALCDLHRRSEGSNLDVAGLRVVNVCPEGTH